MSAQTERRSGIDRRQVSVAAYWYGARQPRRRHARRARDRHYPVIDWHSPRVLALALSILALCVADGVLTIVLLSHGAYEANPFMALFVPNDLGWFAAIKLTLTSAGTFVLVACSRMRLFRRIPGESVLYLVLACYVALIVYEMQMLDLLSQPPDWVA